MEGLIYINPTYAWWDRKPKEDFYAMEISGILYPLINYNGRKQVFVYGYGWVKDERKKLHEIPLYSENPYQWDDYLKKYGKYCMFYSLTGAEYDSRDCSNIKIRSEFKMINEHGISKYLGYASLWWRFHEIQNQVIENMPGMCDAYRYDMIIYPFTSIIGCSLIPIPNAPADDEKLECAYKYSLKKCLETKHPLYSKYKENRNIWEKDRLVDALEYAKDLGSKISLECDIEVGMSMLDGTFPVCMRDRMILLYGQEASDLYDQMIHYNWD